MKIILTIFLAAFLGSSLGSSAEILREFSDFKVKFNKVYKDNAEERYRLGVFSHNLRAVNDHNRGQSSYTRAINQFSDLTQEEFEATYLGGYKRLEMPERGVERSEAVRTRDLPSSVDWRDRSAVTAIKDQGSCGSCWAFAATEQIESYTAIASGELIELSTQQMTSCTPNPLACGGTGGCQGSTPPLGYNYVQLFGQIAESDYPYVSGSTSQSEECQYDLSSLSPVAAITGYNNLPSNNQEAVMEHIANVGPLAISVAASSWSSYGGGIYSGCSYDSNIRMNHGVQLVGYGSEEGQDYWIVRNSWGSSWGEDGYIRLLREASPGCGTDTTTTGHVCEGGPGNDLLHVCGMCGLLFETSYPMGAHKI